MHTVCGPGHSHSVSEAASVALMHVCRLPTDTVSNSFINTHKPAEKKYKKNNKKQYIKQYTNAAHAQPARTAALVPFEMITITIFFIFIRHIGSKNTDVYCLTICSIYMFDYIW